MPLLTFFVEKGRISQRVFRGIAAPKMQTGINIALHFDGFGTLIRGMIRGRLHFHMAEKLFRRFGIVPFFRRIWNTAKGRWYVL